jgi:hypothetical protein
MITQITGVQRHRTLGVVQIATADRDQLQYIASHTAIKNGQIEVRELGEGGRVDSLHVLNRSEHLVFMMDGDVLAGAKQDRVLNTSVLLAPGSKTRLPVSCVEQGRWRRVSETFTGRDFSAPAFMRSMKARHVMEGLSRNEGHVSHQGDLWDGVSSLSGAAHVQSATHNLSDVYAQRARDLTSFADALLPDPGANGLALFLGHRLLCVDLFHRTDVFREYFPRIVRGVAMEAVLAQDPAQGIAEAEGRFRTQDLLDRYEGMTFREFPGVGVGTDRRFDNEDITGCELRFGERMVHLALLTPRPRQRSAA